MATDFRAVARQLASVGRRLYSRGWALGTSGNFSAVLTRRPLTLAITSSGVPKGELSAADILRCDERGNVIGRTRRRPSAETLLHIEVVRLRQAGAVLHTHSVWSTMLSDLHSAEGGMTIEGYEMLKGLAGVATHDHAERIPIVENDQDIPRLAGRVAEVLNVEGAAHAFLLRRHGLYTWGATIGDAERHVEILEFLFETIGRTPTVYGAGPRRPASPRSQEVRHGGRESS